jgi:tRNA A-37 threonylcarbamoyl transferase component Bud32
VDCPLWKVQRDQETSRWAALVDAHLPVHEVKPFWRYSRATVGESLQGWKFHVSANLTTACDTFEAIAEYLADSDLPFKAIASLELLSLLNAGVYGITQVGKVMTVYAAQDRDATILGRDLARLTSGFTAPAVPYEPRVSEDSPVFYRYGAFVNKSPDQTLADLTRPDGRSEPDERGPGRAVPLWIEDIFPRRAPRAKAASPLSTRFATYECVLQRGRGGVYRALDLDGHPAVRCIVKEGRHHGEQLWDARDGAARVAFEALALRALRASGVKVPAVIDTFRIDRNQYVVLENIEGATLAELIERRADLSVEQLLGLASDLASLVAAIHAAGWAWRDCKPTNVIQRPDGDLCAIDFEGGCSLDSRDHLPWGTAAYLPVEVDPEPALQDVYALGVCIQEIFSSLSAKAGPPYGKPAYRRGTPAMVRRLVEGVVVRRQPTSAAKIAIQLQASPGRVDAGRAFSAAG